MTKLRLRAFSSGLACWVVVWSPIVGAEEDDAVRTRPRYELIDLGIPYASVTSRINNKGQIVGTNTLSPTGPGLAYLWKDGHFVYIKAVGGTDSQGIALNDRGEVVGSAQNAQNTYVGLLYRLGESEALPMDLATGINDRGQIVGTSNVKPPPGVQQASAAQLYQEGSVTDLGSLGGFFSNAFAINERGEIVGQSSTTETVTPLHAFLYRRGKMTDVGTLGGLNSTATGINSRGTVTGFSDMPEMSGMVYEHAFVYRSGRLIDLGVVSGDLGSSGEAINDSGEVVGFSTTSTGTSVAMVYIHGRMWHLQDLVEPSSTLVSHVNLYQATGVNNKGWISVNGYDTDNKTPPNQFFGLPRSYLLRPIR